MTETRVIVVIGMHRSGTSAMTRGLEALGVFLGESLNPPSPGINDKGFFEDIDILDINIRLLGLMRHRWDSVTVAPRPDLSDPAIRDLVGEAIDVLREKLEGPRLFGMKDPRITILLPFWQHVFSLLAVIPSFVIAVRNPLSVADSLRKRDGFSRELGMHLWQKYMLHCLSLDPQAGSVFVEYDRFIEHPADELARIASRIQLDVESRKPAIDDYVNEFLEEGLRHSKYQPEDLQRLSIVPSFVSRTYRTLLELATDSRNLKEIAASGLVDELRREWTSMNDAAFQLDQLQVRLAGLEDKITTIQQALDEANALVQVRDENIAACDALIRQRDEQIAALSKLLAETQQQLHETAAIVMLRDSQLADSDSLVLERDAEITRLRTLQDNR
jgi:hypothetical protein